MSGHVVVCGLGSVGFRVVGLLRRLGREVVVLTLDARQDWLREAREAGATVLVGDARDAALRQQARLQQAEALVSTTSLDLVNLETALDARRECADLRVVARLFDRNLARAVEDTLGDARAFGSSALAGPLLALSVTGEPALGAFRALGAELVARRATDGSLSVTQRPAPGSADAGPPARASTWRALASAWSGSPRPLRVVFLSLLALIAISVVVFDVGMGLGLGDALYYVITTVTTTGYGDITPKDHGLALKMYACAIMVLGSLTTAVLYSFATDFVVGERVRAALGRTPPPKGGHVIVVGIGNVGYRCAEELVAAGRDIVVVDLLAAADLAVSLRDRAAVVDGDGRQPAVLESAGVAGARAIVAATGDDAANLAIALAARSLAPRIRTVVRLFDAAFASKVEDGRLVDAALSASRAAAPVFAAAALVPGVVSAWIDGDALVAISEIDAPPEWARRTVKDVAKVDHVDVLLATGCEPVKADRELRAGERLLVARRLAIAPA